MVIEDEENRVVPSIELVKAALKYPIEVDCHIPYDINIEEILGYTNPDKPNDLYFSTDSPGLGIAKVNIYELASRAKEFIYRKFRVRLQSCIDDVDWMCEIRMVGDRPQWFARTEPEAILRACDDILKDPEQKGYKWN